MSIINKQFVEDEHKFALSPLYRLAAKQMADKLKITPKELLNKLIQYATNNEDLLKAISNS